jgi:hypothetical protein
MQTATHRMETSAHGCSIDTAIRRNRTSPPSGRADVLGGERIVSRTGSTISDIADWH